VRTFFLQSAAQWFVDFHVDALRLDAIHSIADSTATPFLADLSALAGELGETLDRPCALIAESSDNNPLVVTARRDGGIGMDAQWNDDFHHALHAALTGESLGYYVDFGSVGDVARAMREGFVYQGEYSRYRRRRHGVPSVALEPERFVVFAQNHDHIGNRPRGERLASLVPVDRQRLAAALRLLAPGVPLLFMGEEYGETAPFPYFVDHPDDQLAEAVRAGRAHEMHGLGFDEEPLDPSAESTFAMAAVDRGLCHRDGHRELLALHRRLIELRRTHPALARSHRDQVEVSVSGALLSLTRRHRAGAVAALFNLGAEPGPVAAPGLLTGAAPEDRWCWRRLLDSADPTIGGSGAAQPESVAPGQPLVLGPWAFCLYASAPAPPGSP
jgi:maltooligosyltrehalose trehalohydrolase